MPYQKQGYGMSNAWLKSLFEKEIITKEAIQDCNTLKPNFKTDIDRDSDDDFSHDHFTDAD